MKKILLFVAIILTLQGCAVAVVAGAAAVAVASGTVIVDNRSTKTIVEDRDLTNKIQAKLSSDSQLKNSAHVEVATFNRVVLLAGEATTAEMRDRAVSIANTVPKIKLIHNEITLGSIATATVHTNDSWLTTKVKSALLTEQGLHSAQMKIVTENSTVYLMGLVSREQGDLAAKAVSKVDGVKKVVKLFEYKK